MRLLTRVVTASVPFWIVTTGLCGLVSITVQQNYRQSLNDPQIQMAEDAAAFLVRDYTPAAVVPRGTSIDIGSSLAPWIAVYDSSGRTLESDATLSSAPPALPAGVFTISAWGAPFIGHHFNTAPPNENRFTWQPEPAVRQAVVLVYYTSAHGSGFVASGRNMREVENRESNLTFMVTLAWLAIIGTTFVWQLLVIRFLPKD